MPLLQFSSQRPPDQIVAVLQRIHHIAHESDVNPEIDCIDDCAIGVEHFDHVDTRVCYRQFVSCFEFLKRGHLDLSGSLPTESKRGYKTAGWVEFIDQLAFRCRILKKNIYSC